METVLLILAILSATGAAILFVIAAASSSSRQASARLQAMVSKPAETQFTPGRSTPPRTDSLPTLTKLLTGRSLTERLYSEIAAAGLPIRPSEFLAVSLGSLVLFELIATVIQRGIVGYVLLGIIGATLPFAVLKVLQAKRRAAFDAQIVDALMMIASSLRSGFSFLRAMQMVSKEMQPPISKEFERAINEMNVGRPLEDALRGIATRVRSYDFDLVVTAVTIQHQVGGNLADVLEAIAATIRDRLRIQGEIRALTAEGRISGIVLIALPIGLAILLTLLRPGYMGTLFQESIGRLMIAVAVVLQIIGALVIHRMLQVDI
ncbi:MAG: type II secretion system F family protein [Armatimonadetes bacterium]|nr:type II secretion system F family protein [Armatimonadota bacterium]